VTAADFVAHAPEFFGLGDRQRLEHHLMNEGEDRGRGADTQGERNHRGGGESGRFSESTKRFLQIRHFVPLLLDQTVSMISELRSPWITTVFVSISAY